MENLYESYNNYLEEDIELYNQYVNEHLETLLEGQLTVYETIDVCKKCNSDADKVYLKKYPTHRNVVNICKKAVSLIESFIVNEYNEYIVENMLQDIEYSISTGVLTESHVKRLLRSPMELLYMPIYKTRFKELRPRLEALYNSEISIVKHKLDDFELAQPLNEAGIIGYLKLQKLGYEESLVMNDLNGDYERPEGFEIDINAMLMVDEYVSSDYSVLEMLSPIDKFKLETNGLVPIRNVEYEGKEYFVHNKNNHQYLLYKLNESTYYMVTRLLKEDFKAYKVTIKENTQSIDKITYNQILESLFITNEKKIIKRR